MSKKKIEDIINIKKGKVTEKEIVEVVNVIKDIEKPLDSEIEILNIPNLLEDFKKSKDGLDYMIKEGTNIFNQVVKESDGVFNGGQLKGVSDLYTAISNNQLSRIKMYELLLKLQKQIIMQQAKEREANSPKVINNNLHITADDMEKLTKVKGVDDDEE